MDLPAPDAKPQLRGAVSSATSRSRFARDLRRRAESAVEGGVTLPPQEVVERFSPPLPGGGRYDPEVLRDRRRFATSLLAQHGIRVEPPLAEADRQPVRLRATQDFAVHAALVLGVLVTVVGYVAYWPYGLAFAVATALAVWLLARRFTLVDRTVPRSVPRGRTLGVLVVAAVLTLAFLFVVLPVRAERVDDSAAASAAGLVQAADASLQAGDLDGAERLLGEAASVDPRTPALEGVRSRIIAARVVEQLERRDGP